MSQQSYIEFKAQSADMIALAVSEIGVVDQETHWDLVDEMIGSFCIAAAKDSNVDQAGQNSVMSGSVEWVAKNCSSGGVDEDVSMALWLRGVQDGMKYLQQAAVNAQIERG